VVFLDSSTEFSITPVIVGSEKAPTNRVNQITAYVVSLTEQNGVGSAKKVPSIESSKRPRNDCGELYPPKLEKKIPPKITPIKGAVRHVNAKK